MVSGFLKIINPEGAIKLVNLFFPFENESFSYIIVYFISLLEIGLAIYSFFDNTNKSVIMMIILLFFFNFVLVILIIRDVKITQCGCFGTILPEHSLGIVVLRNIILSIFLFLILEKK